MEDSLRSWCKQELSKRLKSEVDDDVVKYLLSMETSGDVKDYLQSVLGRDSPEFTREFLVRWTAVKEGRQHHHGNKEVVVPHVKPSQDELVLFVKEKPKKTKMTIPSHSSTKHQSPPGLTKTAGSTIKTKTQFVPLLSAEGQTKMTVRFPGRHPCQCLGQKHELVNNCLECGRIVCSQEGPGPCLFCGTLVLTREEEKLLQRDSKRADKMKDKLWKQYGVENGNNYHHQSNEEGLSQATSHKDKLLDFDRTSACRTKVIDDESDYFSVDSKWLPDKEKQLLKEKHDKMMEEKYSRTNKITLDFAGRKVIEENSPNDFLIEEHITQSPEKLGQYEICQDSLCNPTIPISPPIYTGKHNKKKATKGQNGRSIKDSLRIQDRSLLEMSDGGHCLSLHQPWASLLVSGIKQVEGQSWYTSHRGKLWIAAAAEVPESKVITDVTQFYTAYYGEEITFPLEYPTSCLLGCVEVLDCLAQEDYRQQYPNGESESPYVFICENPQELLVKYPVKGKHKIWKLPKDIHTAAKRSFQTISTIL